MMPKRQRTRAQNRAKYVASERRLNRQARQAVSCGPAPPSEDDEPAFLGATARTQNCESSLTMSRHRSDMGGILSSGQGEAAATTVVAAAASLTGESAVVSSVSYRRVSV